MNGVREPTITMRPGEVQRWRILHAGWQDDIFMDLEGHTLNPIARDGIPLDPDRVDQRVRLGAVEEWTICLVGYADPPAQWQHHLPIALARFHRQIHAPLPHDEP